MTLSSLIESSQISDVEKESLVKSLDYYQVDPDKITITVDPGALELFVYPARKPVYALIGKPVTKSIAAHLLRITDIAFSRGTEQSIECINEERDRYHDFLKCIEDCTADTISEFKEHAPYPRVIYSKIIRDNNEWKEVVTRLDDLYFQNNWFEQIDKEEHPEKYQRRFDEIPPEPEPPNGWLHPSGPIYQEDYFRYKYPNIFELMRFWVLLTNWIKNLDVVIALTKCDEQLTPGSLFEQEITHGLHIAGTHISILNKENTLKIYQEYKSIYPNSQKKSRKPTEKRLRNLYEDCRDMNDYFDLLNDVYRPDWKYKRIQETIPSHNKGKQRSEENETP